jgi:hypothetical protein
VSESDPMFVEGQKAGRTMEFDEAVAFALDGGDVA